MARLHKIRYQLSLLVGTAAFIILTLAHPPRGVSAQEPWPPFWFDLIPSYENGKIIYNVALYSRVDQQLLDLAIKIPIPGGTRFLEASALPELVVEYDGLEVTFFASALDEYIENASFTVEVTDPTQPVFTTQAWISWKGALGGDYLAEPVSIDITRQPLNWNAPGRPRLQLGMGATVAADMVTYTFYPRAVGQRRMWDVEIRIPLPEGTTFLSSEAPSPFVTSFDGQQVSFFAIELEQQVEVGPLTFWISTAGITDPAVVMRAWAAWTNVVDPWEGLTIPAQEQYLASEIVVQPHMSRRIVFDTVGDVPFSNYDLTSIAFQEVGSALTVIFNTVGDIGPVGQPLEYILYIDSDCNGNTGEQIRYRGAEYLVRYDRQMDWAEMVLWSAEESGWDWSRGVELSSLADGNTVMVSIPHNLNWTDEQFCWIGAASNNTQAFNSNPPEDWLPDEEYLRLTQYEVVSPTVTGISGKLAIPLNNEQDSYNVRIFSLPDGQEIANIPNARQPIFQSDGQRLLINRESSSVGNAYDAGGQIVLRILRDYSLTQAIYEYNLADGTEERVSNDPSDSYPFYDPQGRQVVYGNSELMVGTSSAQSDYILVQCSLLPPSEELELRCRDLLKFRVLVSAAQATEIRGNYPVWTTDGMIAYQGCGSEAEVTSCGIYKVSSRAIKGNNIRAVPIQVTQDASDIPSDTKGNLIAFTSQRDGNWEAYVVNLDGTHVRNLSNSPDSSDGLPTISPDGNWVAFVSDRDGQWAVWVAPVTRGPAQKLFDLPTDIPWGSGDRTWTTERISWGP